MLESPGTGIGSPRSRVDVQSRHVKSTNHVDCGPAAPAEPSLTEKDIGSMRNAAPLHGSLSRGKVYSELVEADSVSFDRTSDEGIETRSFAGFNAAQGDLESLILSIYTQLGRWETENWLARHDLESSGCRHPNFTMQRVICGAAELGTGRSTFKLKKKMEFVPLGTCGRGDFDPLRTCCDR